MEVRDFVDVEPVQRVILECAYCGEQEEYIYAYEINKKEVLDSLGIGKGWVVTKYVFFHPEVICPWCAERLSAIKQCKKEEL